MTALGAEVTVIRAGPGRAAARRSLTLRTLAREPQVQPFQATVVDLSTDGCRITGDFALEQGTSLWVRLPGLGARQARIAWARAGEAGCEFAVPIPEEAFDQLFAADRARRATRQLRGSGEG